MVALSVFFDGLVQVSGVSLTMAHRQLDHSGPAPVIRTGACSVIRRALQKLDHGWPESKKCLSSSSEDGRRKR
jgi:hypothetical protein